MLNWCDIAYDLIEMNEDVGPPSPFYQLSTTSKHHRPPPSHTITKLRQAPQHYPTPTQPPPARWPPPRPGQPVKKKVKAPPPKLFDPYDEHIEADQFKVAVDQPCFQQLQLLAIGACDGIVKTFE
ncbi:hypothetical protein LTR22_004077 [Elasticomyces elasticus]|nr:hypothetical protein LTR22_004077 [Elasticomyces elasticus]KAK4931600.1 hypothetical protein LTR49_001990 [Elasticomyces elasticus]KAK5766759.1 hypothetical protein LTS12_003110 [Elasticomyces elasticus]